MNISFNIPVKDHFLYNPKDSTGRIYWSNFHVIEHRTFMYQKGIYSNLPEPIVADHEYIDGKIFYKTGAKSTFLFTFDVDVSILPFMEVHVFQYHDGRLLLEGPVEIHFSGPEELGVLLKLSY